MKKYELTFVRNNKMDKQEMIELLRKNGIEPDERCSQEDLEALIDYEEIPKVKLRMEEE